MAASSSGLRRGGDVARTGCGCRGVDVQDVGGSVVTPLCRVQGGLLAAKCPSGQLALLVPDKKADEDKAHSERHHHQAVEESVDVDRQTDSTCTDTQTHRHTHTHARTHARTHTHIHAQ